MSEHTLQAPAGLRPIAPASKRWRPDALVLACSGMLLCFCWRTQDVIPGLSTARVTILFSLLAIALYVSNGRRERRFDLLTGNKTFMALIGLFGVMIIGIPMSYWPGKSFRFLQVDHIKTILFLIVLAGSIRRKEDVTWYLKVWLVGAVLYTVDALLHFRMTADGRWANLIYYDANDYGALLVTTIPLAVYFLRSAAPLIHRLAAAGMMGMFAIGLVNSGSRGAFLGFVVAMAYILTQFKALSKRLRVGVVVVAVGGLTFFAQDTYWEMMETILNPQEDYNMTSNTGRKAVWTRGIGYMLQNPFVGVGVRAFSQAEGASETSQQLQSMGSGFKWSAAHNSFVEIGAETGVTGLVLFLMAFFTAIKSLALIRESPRCTAFDADEVVLGQALIGSFIAFMVAGSFVSHGNYAYVYGLLALAIGMAKLYPVPRVAPGGQEKQGVRRQPAVSSTSGPSARQAPRVAERAPDRPQPGLPPVPGPRRKNGGVRAPRDRLAPLMAVSRVHAVEFDAEWDDPPTSSPDSNGSGGDEGWGPLT